MHQQLASLLHEDHYEAIHADQLWMAPYALAARTWAMAHCSHPLTVLDQHNAVHLVPERMATATRSPLKRAALRREATLMARYEAAACQAFDQVVCVTEADRKALQGLPSGQRPTPPVVIPICVDPNAGAPVAAPATRDGRVLFLAGMHWPPNADGARWFAEAIWPRIRVRAPEAEFWAVGKQPPVEVASPGAAARGLHAAGYIADLEEHWACARVFVVPLRSGGGMRVKILEAWLRGVPVVSTTVGAEGLATAAGENILLADEPEAFAAAVEQVLTDPALAARLGAGGRATVEQHYDWRNVYAGWDTVYDAA
jgi:glycosyltransferase involved in cell wall biosynthesis